MPPCKIYEYCFVRPSYVRETDEVFVGPIVEQYALRFAAPKRYTDEQIAEAWRARCTEMIATGRRAWFLPTRDDFAADLNKVCRRLRAVMRTSRRTTLVRRLVR